MHAPETKIVIAARSDAITWVTRVTAYLTFALLSANLCAQTLEEGKPRGLPFDEQGNEKRLTGWTIHFDNDLLIPGSDRDQDYTGGLGLTIGGDIARSSWWSVDPLLGVFDRWSGLAKQSEHYFRLHAAQFGLLVFSPADIGSSVALYDDRPFANLLYLANSRRYINLPDQAVYQSVLTFGILGSGVGEVVQEGIHDAVGSDAPEGWGNQVSDGGEPTFQYSISRQALLASNFQAGHNEYELKYSVGGSIGYITEASTALSVRWGKINTPWWSFTPENVDYASQPAPVIGNSVPGTLRELYLWGGIKARARAYNVFLQGQFRDSEVEFRASDINPIIGEAWLGLTSQFNNYRVSYIVRYQTSELKSGVGARDPLWAGLIFAADF